MEAEEALKIVCADHVHGSGREVVELDVQRVGGGSDGEVLALMRCSEREGLHWLARRMAQDGLVERRRVRGTAGG